MATTRITGIHQDAEGDWVAELACGHQQHVRHRPPWQLRPWVATDAGRAARIGQVMECPKCDAPVEPSGPGSAVQQEPE